MRITYDPEADAVYIKLRSGHAVSAVDLEDGITADLDDGGHVIGMEILNATRRLGSAGVEHIDFARLGGRRRRTPAAAPVP